MRSVLLSLLIGVASGLLGCGRGVAQDVKLGAVDREKQPSLKDLAEPKDDKDVPKVGLRASVTGEVKLKKAKNLYVLVNPLSNPTTSKNTWWVQQPVSLDGDRLRATCQFGEPGEGRNEYFALVICETDEEYETGQQLNALPSGKAWSNFKIVKRD